MPTKKELFETAINVDLTKPDSDGVYRTPKVQGLPTDIVRTQYYVPETGVLSDELPQDLQSLTLDPQSSTSYQIWETRRDGQLSIISANPCPSLTRQEFADECDINNIIGKYQSTGELTHIARSTGVYADLSKIGSYQEALQTVEQAEDAFMTLPSKLRDRFENDPQKFLDFIDDPKNYDEGVTLGIYEPKIPNVTPPQNAQKTNEPNEQK